MLIFTLILLFDIGVPNKLKAFLFYAQVSYWGVELADANSP